MPIVIYSTFLDKKSIENPIKLGVKHLVTKYHKLTEFVEILTKVLNPKDGE